MIGLAVCILVAFALRQYRIDAQSIWFDEGWSAYAAVQPTLIDAFNADATNPPLYYGLLHIAAQGFGTSELALRFFSLLVGLPVIPLTYQLAKRAAGNRAGVVAALLTTFSAPLWWASQEARMYTLLALLIVIIALAWQRLQNESSRAAWFALWSAELALLYTHNTGPVIVLWLNLVFITLWLMRRTRYRFYAPSLRIWFVGQIGVGLLYLPYFITRFILLSEANSAVQSNFDLTTLWQTWQGMWVAPWSFAESGKLLTVGVVILLSGLVLIAALRKPGRWLMFQGVLLIACLIVGLVVLGNELHGRYLVMIVPLIAAAVGAGLASRPILAYGSGILAVALFALSFSAYRDPLYGHDDVRGMVGYYARNLTADDTVLAWSYADRYDLAYYWDRLGVAANRVTLPEGADLDAVLPLLPTSGRVALNIWYTQRADYRGMMGCVLGHGSESDPIAFTTYGMTDLLYEHALEQVPEMRDFEVGYEFSGATFAEIKQVATLPAFAADQAVCIPVTIFSQSFPGDAPKVALIVRNDLGWEITQTDAIIATANQQLPSSGSLLRTTSAAFPLLELPYGTPAGDYPIFLRLYDEVANPSGYEPLTSEETVGRDVLIGVWHATEPDHSGENTSQTGLMLLPVDLPPDGSVLRNGDPIRLTMIWEGNGETESVVLRDSEGRWLVEVGEAITVEGARREWYELVVPADAESGEALLMIGEREIARYPIEAAPMLADVPAFGIGVDADFPDVGRLVGATLPDESLTLNQPPRVTLIWQGGEVVSEVSYTVFVQLVDTDGNVIAQSDSLPVAGSRPTTGWRDGEYIVDEHTLTFNDRAHSGDARLIAGLYDAVTGQRAILSDGADYVMVAENVRVSGE